MSWLSDKLFISGTKTEGGSEANDRQQGFV